MRYTIGHAAAVLFELRQAGLTVEIVGERIEVTGRRSKIDQYRETIKANKPALLAYLRQCQMPALGLRHIGGFTAAVATNAALDRPAGVETRHQPAEPIKHGDENSVHNCMSCMHWQGVDTFNTDGHIVTRGVCAAGSRPWRKSNIPSELAFYHWHYIGACADQQEDINE